MNTKPKPVEFAPSRIAAAFMRAADYFNPHLVWLNAGEHEFGHGKPCSFGAHLAYLFHSGNRHTQGINAFSRIIGANPAQLALLLADAGAPPNPFGGDEWNPGDVFQELSSKASKEQLILPSVEASNLRGMDFTECDMTAARMRKAVLQDACGVDAVFRFADMEKANLADADFRKANLLGACLRQANASGIDLADACLEEACCVASVFSDAHLWGANLAHADFFGADLSRADMRGVQAREIQLSETTLTDCNMERAKVPEADLFGKNAENKISCLRMNGQQSDWDRARIRHVDFRDADLREARFTATWIVDANFSNADLRDANFTDANVENIDLTGARTEGAIGLEPAIEAARLRGYIVRGWEKCETATQPDPGL